MEKNAYLFKKIKRHSFSDLAKEKSLEVLVTAVCCRKQVRLDQIGLTR